MESQLPLGGAAMAAAMGEHTCINCLNEECLPTNELRAQRGPATVAWWTTSPPWTSTCDFSAPGSIERFCAHNLQSASTIRSTRIIVMKSVVLIVSLSWIAPTAFARYGLLRVDSGPVSRSLVDNKKNHNFDATANNVAGTARRVLMEEDFNL
jgi:hypothetical protein